MPQEIEIKFPVSNLRRLQGRLREAGFHLVTPSQREVNTLYDLPGEKLRKRRELLRLRSYGKSWTLTHKSGRYPALFGIFSDVPLREISRRMG